MDVSDITSDSSGEWENYEYDAIGRISATFKLIKSEPLQLIGDIRNCIKFAR